jgi:hypothetical protein
MTSVWHVGIACFGMGALISLSLSKSFQKKSSDRIAKIESNNEGKDDISLDTQVSEDYQDRPRHLAVVMDGNRRYGRQNLGNAMQGHWQGGRTGGWNEQTY